MARSKLPCNMDCFNCIHPDCINDVQMSRQQEWYYLNREEVRKKENEKRREKYQEKIKSMTAEELEARKEKRREYYHKNKEQLSEQRKKRKKIRTAEALEAKKEKNRKYYNEHKAELLARSNAYYKENHEERKAYQREYEAAKRARKEA